MSSSTSAPGNGNPAAKTDLETLKNDMKALRSDLAALLRDTGSLAQEQAKAAAAKGRALAEDAGEKAEEYKEAVADKVREHPLAAVGIALAAGFVQIPARRVGEHVGHAKLLGEARVDPLEALLDHLEELTRASAREDAFAEAQLARDPRARSRRSHPTSLPAARFPPLRCQRSGGFVARCSATMPNERLRYATSVQPASRIHAESVRWSGHEITCGW